MKCPKCLVTMDKDYDTRTATCPICGRTKPYKSNADKKLGYRYYPEYDYNRNSSSNSYSGFISGYDYLIKIAFIAILIAVIAVIICILVLAGVFKNGFWDGLGSIGMFFVNIIWSVIKFVATIIWTVIKFIGTTIWSGITGLYHLIFG